MILKDLRIRLMEYGKDEGKYVGTVEFTNKAGDITINLTAEHCNKIFEVCGDAILDTVKEAATNLTAQVIEHKKSIENKS